MNSSTLLPLAAFLDFNIPGSMVAILVPIVAIAFGCSIAIVAIYFEHQKKKLLHDTARLALERGQPIPPEIMAQIVNNEEEKPAVRTPMNDVRTGLILIAVGVGIYLFFAALSVEKMRFVGAIPGLIGVALLLFGVGAAIFSGKKSGHDLTPRS